VSAPRASRAARGGTAAAFPWWAAGASIFAAILLARWEVLRDPPYWDHALSLWPEAHDLAQKRFNFLQHWLEEPTWLAGGKAAYRFSVLPALIAVLMSTLPSPAASFIAYRLMTFACASAAALLLYGLLRRTEGRATAALATAAVLTAPIFSTQIDMLGMEIPLALAASAVAALVAAGRFAWAAAAAFAGMFVKATMIIVVLAVACTVAVLLLFGSRSDRLQRRRLWFGLLTSLGTVPAAAILLVGVEADAVVRFLRFEPIRWAAPLLWCPDLVFLSAWGLVAYVGWLAGASGLGGRPDSFSRRLAAEPLALFAAVAAAGVFLSFAFVQSLPRYLTFAVPLIVALFVFALRVSRMKPWTRAGLLTAIVAVNLFNWSGALYPSGRTVSWLLQQRGTDLADREGSMLERSRAYLDDHRRNIAAMKALDEAWDGAPVFAGAPFCYFLAIPALGYVDRPLSGYATNGFHYQVGAFRDAAHAAVDRPENAWFVYSRNPFYQRVAWFVVPPPRTGRDFVLFDDKRPSPVVVYRRTFLDEEREPFRGNWFLGRLRGHPDWQDPPRATAAESLARIGRSDLWERFQRESARSTATARE
jgi:hypothetical protein